MTLSEAEKQILIASRLITRDGKVLNEENYRLFSNYFYADELLDWTNAFQTMVTKDLLVSRHDCYYMTIKGTEIARSLLTNRGFSRTLIDCEASKTYGLFCERVYGKNLTQFNMMDMEQLNKLLETLELDQNNKVLELGCGIGTVTEYISDTTKAQITGLDFAEGAINRALQRTKNKRKRLKYVVGNMNTIDFPDNSFDTIIAIDTLYFVENLTKTINMMKKILKPHGQMGIFYSHMVNSEENKKDLVPDKSPLAKALRKNSLKYTTEEFTNNEKNIWTNEKKIVEDLKQNFEEEGNIDIYYGRRRETQYILPFITSGRNRRDLFHVTS